ncbi:hypothetical protein CK210_14495 [Vibrio anguillarum]|nr:hypothetical protein PN51_09910 [Vibrio anguillarum]AUB88486.1 hypothetical protein CKY00_14490 [Vibrio anguillarum]AUB91927.1 hypothetical protein CKX99_14505 [Vibrio anguillarum]AUB95364.1 hypothetical protein CK210_14495 [Vibrio anguillarum]AUB98782.1 hypothetical protein CK209_14425 [Vibrio anguillarum]
MSDLLHQLLPLYQRRPYWQSFRSKTDEKVSATTLMWLYFKFDKKMTQTVAFGVTSQKEFLYNAFEITR